MRAINKWELEYRDELIRIYQRFFKGNPLFKITYEDFVTYCYKHTNYTSYTTR